MSPLKLDFSTCLSSTGRRGHSLRQPQVSMAPINVTPLTCDSVTLFLAACLFIFVLPNKVFAWFEYVTSLIKIVIFLIIIILSLALVLGAGPNGHIHHGETWTTLPPFLNGFSVSHGNESKPPRTNSSRDLPTVPYLLHGPSEIRYSLELWAAKPRVLGSQWPTRQSSYHSA